jgi:hypothetical protein
MDRVKIDLKHCYGIKELKESLDFSKTPVYAIYAPNGVMKSSLAQTFQDAASEVDSHDRIFPNRVTMRQITDEDGKDINGERVLVIKPYDEGYGPTEKTSTLLVDATLRKEYEQLHVTIDKSKTALLKAIGKQAKSRRNFEIEISSAFTNGDDFEVALNRIKDELEKQKKAPFGDVKYDIVFNEKVLKALDTRNLKDAVENYIRRYNELLSASTYFKKGTFDYYNAGQIAKNLADNGFFDALHTVNLNASTGDLEINTQNELEDVIAKEKEAILEDKQLQKKFDDVAKQLEKNIDLRNFCQYLQDNEGLLSKMNNLAKFKEDVLKSYIKVQHSLYLGLMDTYEEAAKRKKEIEEEARNQQTQWEEVIAIFNDRFFVPFQLETKNRIEVMLGNHPIVDLDFTYVDGEERVTLDKAELLNVLSTGERKALYILNVIFEIQRRNKDQLETLVVVDDIADSFDYQNKYAIVQYLDEISKDGLFKLIIMTHNFDFFRTIMGRFVGYPRCLMASKNAQGITLSKATGIQNIFANDWKKNFFTNSRKKIASIPFLRNLVEMTTGEDDQNYQKLTSMLHWKAGSATTNVGQLDVIYNSICKTDGVSVNASMLVCDLIETEAEGCLADGDGLNLENKIVLAVAIRLAADKLMIGKINDDEFVAGIKFNQTQLLMGKFKEIFPDEDATIKVLARVALMTPENIHVNSFMYEPIVDMADDHLKKLYTDLSRLKL